MNERSMRVERLFAAITSYIDARLARAENDRRAEFEAAERELRDAIEHFAEEAA